MERPPLPITYRHAMHILRPRRIEGAITPSATFFDKDGMIDIFVTFDGEVVLARNDVPQDMAFYLLVDD